MNQETHLTRLETLACQSLTTITALDSESLLWACREIERLQAIIHDIDTHVGIDCDNGEFVTADDKAQRFASRHELICALFAQEQAANAKLRAACKRALADYEIANETARHCGRHPFTLGPADLRDALAETAP